MDIRIKQTEEIHLIGYKGNTNRGFYIIPRLWSRLHGAKHRIPDRMHTDFVTGVNSLAPVMEYIYKEWLPQSGVRINPEYDFARYSESIDERNQSIIEIWIPLL